MIGIGGYAIVRIVMTTLPNSILSDFIGAYNLGGGHDALRWRYGSGAR